MQEPLTPIHDAIARLRRLRAIVRIGSAVAMVVTLGLLTLAVVFLLDWATDAGRLERGVLLVLLVAAIAWATRRWLVPALRTREADTDLALMIQQCQGIDTDLVAAVQFADVRRAQFGSPHLRGAVISYISEVLPNLDLLEGFNTRAMRPSLACAATAILLWVLLIIVAPAHVGAFTARLALAPVGYPTDTRIIRIIEPGVAARAGNPVRFAVQLSGVLPDQATAHLRSVESGLTSQIPLYPTEDDPHHYQGELRIADADLDYDIVAGDARSPTTRLRVAPAPRIDLSVTVTPPAYSGAQAMTATARRVAAPQGSAIDITLQSDQPLREAWFMAGEQRIELHRTKDGYQPRSQGSPLNPIGRSLQVQTKAIDRHGMALDQMPGVHISVQPDQPPTVRAGAVTRRILPTASPRLTIEARDDFGIGRLLLHRTIIPAQGQPVSLATTIAEPAGADDRFEQAVPVPLAGLGLEPGDRVELAVEVIDHRGSLPGEATRSAPIVLDVIDRQALLEMMLEADREMDERLDRIIDAQIDVGGAP